MALVAASCPDRYSGTDRVPLRVSDPDEVVEEAVAYLPRQVPADVSERLARGEAVVRPSEDEAYDLTIYYRTGPMCGSLPEVSVRLDEARDSASVDIVNGTGIDCADAEFDAVIDLSLADDHEDVTVRAVVSDG